MPSGWPRFPETRPLTTMLVLVPIRVHKPPRTTAAFIGMRSLETLSLRFLAQSRMAGTIRATTGVLLTKAESTPGAIIVRSWAEASDVGRPRARSTSEAKAPVRSIAAATTNSAATVIMPSLLIPLSASSGVITPAAKSSTTPPIMTMSGARCTNNSAASVTMTTSAVSIACQLPNSVSAIIEMLHAGRPWTRDSSTFALQPRGCKAKSLAGR